MTCIVGIEYPGGVIIGGDSAGTNSRLSQVSRLDSKVFEIGDMIIGFCGSFRMGQLLNWKLKDYLANTTPQRNGQGNEEWLCTSFIDAVRITFTHGGYNQTFHGEERGGTFLLGYRGSLYNIESDYQVGRSASGYDAIGCGDDLALGSLHTTAGSNLSPKRRVIAALEASEAFSAGVAGPFNIVTKSYRA